MPKTVEIRPLARVDDRSGFSCGQPDLDRYFEHYAGQNQFKLHLAVTYVAGAKTPRKIFADEHGVFGTNVRRSERKNDVEARYLIEPFHALLDSLTWRPGPRRRLFEIPPRS